VRLHHYPGLFDEGVGRGLGIAVAVSLTLHVGLFAALGRFRIAHVDRTFYAPINMVDLVAKPPGPGAGSKPAAPAPAQPEVKPAPAATPAKPPPPAKKSASEVTPPAPKAPPPTAKPKPAPQEKVVSTTPAAPAPAPSTSEERVAERIARLREKLAQPPAAAPPASGPPAGVAESKVRQAVESIRERVQPGDGGGGSGKTGTGALGVRGGASNVLQEVRLRAYYNRLWEHVNANWAIPPSLEGKGYTAIVSAVLDRQGRVLKATIEEPSASAAFDQSALRALERASPLPAFPEEVKDDVLEVGFRFHGE
jgi:TonB family protein